MDTCIHEEVISSNQPNDFTIQCKKKKDKSLAPSPWIFQRWELGERALHVIDPLSKGSSMYININLHNRRKPTQLHALIWLLHAWWMCKLKQQLAACRIYDLYRLLILCIATLYYGSTKRIMDHGTYVLILSCHVTDLFAMVRSWSTYIPQLVVL